MVVEDTKFDGDIDSEVEDEIEFGTETESVRISDRQSGLSLTTAVSRGVQRNALNGWKGSFTAVYIWTSELNGATTRVRISRGISICTQ